MQLIKLIIIGTILFLIPFLFVKNYLLFSLIAITWWAILFAFIKENTRKILKEKRNA